MNNSKMTKKALLSSIVALALCFAMLTGTTFAWFTDSETSANNVIKAGYLDVKLEYSTDMATWTAVEASTNVFDDNALWEPGYTEVVYLRVSNVGNLAFKYKLGVSVAGETLGKTANGADIKLSDYIMYGVVENVTARYADRANARDAIASAVKLNVSYEEEFTLEGMATPEATPASNVFALVTYMPETVGNEVNHNGTDAPSINLGLTVFATQLAAEEDSFGNNYDENSAYTYTSTDVVGGGESLTAGDVVITLPENAVENTYQIVASNKKIETNNIGETTVSMDISLFKDGVKVEAEAGVEYDVTIDIGKGVVVTGLFHNDVAVTNYSYNPTTGLISFKTDSFSPFTVSYESNVTRIYSTEQLISVLSEIKAYAKTQIPGETGNKAYRENAILVLESDIVIDTADSFMYTDSNGAPLHFYGMKGILDLNGHDIKVTSSALLNGKAYSNAVILVQYSNISIVGEGNIIAENKAIPVYAWANCTVDIYSGNYVTNAPERGESAVYVNNTSALVNVYGGTYADSAYAFNVHNNCGSTPTIVLHEGIEYADYFNNNSIDLTADDIAKGRIVFADGCELQEYEENGVAMNKVVTK